ncbi:acyltransferase family protein [Geodermatophilus sp. URMC 64]
MATTQAPPGGLVRWAGLDLARLVVVSGLIFFHAALVFATDDDFYVKNDRTTDVLTPMAAPVVIWAMPLLFLVSGVGTWFAWQRAGGAAFVRRRLRRLAVPLVAGTVLLVPLPVWLRLRADPGYTESYAEFWPRFFRVRVDWSEFPFLLRPAADGRAFETGHLWFLVLLLLYSLAAVPVLSLLCRGRAIERLAAGVGRRTVLAPAVVIAAVTAGLGVDQGIAAWNEVAYGLFFAAGLVLAADDRIRVAVRRAVPVAGAVGLAAFLAAGALLVLRMGQEGADPLVDRDPVSLIGRGCYGVAGWCVTLAITGLLLGGGRPADAAPSSGRGRRLAAYARPAVLPWYVLHQPVVVAVAFVVVGWSAPPVAKYALICAFSVLITLAAYDLLVRRWRVTRWLFGMS